MEYVVSYLVILVEVACFLLFYHIFEKNKTRHRKWLDYIWLILISFALCGLSYMLESLFIVKEIVFILCLAIGTRILKKERLKNALFLSALFAFIVVIIDYITIIIARSIFTIDTSNKILFDMLAILMSKGNLLLLILLIRTRFDWKWSYVKDEVDAIRFAAFPFLSICIIAVFMSNEFGVQGKIETEVVWCMIFCLLAMNLLMVFYMDDITEKNYLLQEKRMFEMDAKGQRNLYQSLEEKISIQRSISHDYKNHISYIQALLEKKEYDRISDYLKQVNGEIDHDLDMIDTNNPIANTVINTKYYEAKNAGAVVVCKINDLSDIRMEETDLILLISNLMNNAIEAVERCKNDRIIRFKIIKEGEEFILSVQNTYDGVIRKKGNCYLTTKTKDRQLHGIGIKNIIRIVEKYDGMYNFDYDESEFRAVVIIPMIKENPA